WIFEGYQCLGPDYDRCLLSLSRGGKDADVKREFSIADKAFVKGGFETPEAKSSMEWLDQDTLLIGTDWGTGSMTDSGYPRVVKRWQRGTPLASAITVLAGEVEDVRVFPQVEKDAQQAWPMVQRSVSFFEFEKYLLGDDGLKKLPLPLQSWIEGVLDGWAIVTLSEDWRYQGATYPQGAMVALNLHTMDAEIVFSPSATQAVESVALGKSSVYVELLDDVQSGVLRLQRHAGNWRATPLPLPTNGVVSISAANSRGNDLLVSYESMTSPDTLYYVDDNNAVSKVMALPTMFDASDVVVEQRFTTSKDGTRVPYFVMARKDVLEKGNAPTIQYGYGGFKIPILPIYFSESARPQHGALAGKLWVSRGGVMVLTNMRGGSEYGPAWHEAVLKQNRHKAFEDFFAVGEALVADGVTTPDKLGAIGRSNGGLLMGAVMLQRPNLYAAIDCGVPLLDMLRYHKLLAGASWVGEYGDPEIADEREYLASYSPYQNLQRDMDYPAMFFYTSTKDDRVHPGHARKMAAKMDEFGYPFLYYENIEGGHGGTANQPQLARRTALEFVFFVRELMD
ncbi:MAG: S9 family peptidase, partial [Gammaproteobacteria bacterium]|nr:S9 family peptidase [Gammaproteobacteria bacterium]